MKKAIYTFGLFSMMMLLTSFTTNTSTAATTSTTTIELDQTDTGGTYYAPGPGKGGKRAEFKDSTYDGNLYETQIQQSFTLVTGNHLTKRAD